MLPVWCMHPVRALFALVNGLPDAIPAFWSWPSRPYWRRVSRVSLDGQGSWTCRTTLCEWGSGTWAVGRHLSRRRRRSHWSGGHCWCRTHYAELRTMPMWCPKSLGA